LSTTNGYALIYNATGNLSIVRITAEASAATIASFNLSVPLTTASDYRLHFTGNGGVLTGEIYDLSAPAVALGSVSGSDATYGSGVGGMFVYDGSSGGSLSASATFDNYSLSDIPEPTSLLTSFLGLAALTVRRRHW
jgi:hypothetical protein